MPINPNIQKNITSLQDFDRLNQEFEMRKQLQQAQIESEKKKLTQIDVDKLGEQAFMKAAMGAKLTPEEQAAAMFIDAKSGGTSFNPVTGEVFQKPRISDKIGLPSMGGGSQLGGNSGYAPAAESQRGYGGQSLPPVFSGLPTGYEAELPEFERKFQAQMAAAAGNPKLQQSIRETYAKEKLQYDESQAKAAGFATRMQQSNPMFEDPAIAEAGMSLGQRAASKLPLIGNYLASDEYQKFDQAQRDFINAQLRRESGAVINPEEFKNAEKQYFPQPGDSEAVLIQKAKNRQAALRAMAQSAGAAYENDPLVEFERAVMQQQKQMGGASPMQRPELQGDVQSLIDMYAR